MKRLMDETFDPSFPLRFRGRFGNESVLFLRHLTALAKGDYEAASSGDLKTQSISHQFWNTARNLDVPGYPN